MPYISTTELAQRPGAAELMLVASSAHQDVIDEALMDATLRSTDRSAWSMEQIVAADAALDRIQDAVAEADALIDGYLVQGGHHLPLPLPLPGAAKSVLTAWSRAITRYLLNKDRVTDESKDPIARDYRDALKRLAEVANRKFSLGLVSQATAEVSLTDVRFESAPSAFGRDQLRHFR